MPRPVVQPPQSADAELLNPDDYEPATPPSAVAPGAAGHATRGTVEGLPTYDQESASGSLPQLSLDLHVYAARPQERFVFLNMLRLREGDSTPDGVRVERITPDGVVLSHRGSRFVLERQ